MDYSSDHIHFTKDEFEQRRLRVVADMEASNLDYLLIFRQESMYWLTGYDTFGYVFFQCLLLDRTGKYTLLTRQPDVRTARFTSIIEDIHIWRDAPDADPAGDLKRLLDSLGRPRSKMGIEWDAYGLSAYYGRRVAEVLGGESELVDMSRLITGYRLVKSPAEIEYVRRASSIADLALEDVYGNVKPGAFEGDILGSLQNVIFRNDGDYPANENIVGSGPADLMGRYFSGRRKIDQEDQLFVEFAGVYRRYHSVLMRVLRIGPTQPRQAELHKIAVDALHRCREAARPGRCVGDMYTAFVDEFKRSTFVSRMGTDLALPFAIGYSLGATFAPNWMDYPKVFSGNSVVLEENMVFFLHLSLRDDRSGMTVAPGETIVIGKHGGERLSSQPLDLFTVS